MGLRISNMPKQLLWATIRVPDNPRVRFFVKSPKGKQGYEDVTSRVAKLVIEQADDDSGACELLRFDKDGKLVWKTRHLSLQETKWHVEFEYGLPEEKWTAV